MFLFRFRKKGNRGPLAKKKLLSAAAAAISEVHLLLPPLLRLLKVKTILPPLSPPPACSVYQKENHPKQLRTQKKPMKKSQNVSLK